MTQQLSLPLEGVQSCKEALIHKTTPINNKTLSIAKLSLDSLEKFFDKNGHKPTLKMWSALASINLTMEAMAEGTLASKIYVSSLDPGVGKSQSIIHFVQTLLRSTSKHAGVIICVSRLSEVESFVGELGLSKNEVSVLTSDKNLNALGGSPESCPVLITTQQMIEQRCKHASFSETEVFHYNDYPRKVRIWDEAILPGQTLTLSRYDITDLFKPLNHRSPKLVDRLESIFTELRDFNDGETLKLPSFEEEYGIGLNDVLAQLQEATDDQIRTAEALWHVSGRMVSVRKDDRYGNTLLDFKETLPDDLKPMLVLDASARVRETYSLWEDYRGDLEVLPSATKDYSNLNIHIWKKGGGKSSFRDNPHTLIEGIVNTINKKPNEEWLVVYHKNVGSVDVVKDVRSKLGSRSEEVHFINWGNHHGTNAYKDISNVILAGTLFYRPSHYESLGRLAANRSAEDGVFTKSEARQVTIGEHRHLILQALCRGSVRKCIDGGCSPCDAYIIASPRSGIPKALPDIFPGSNIAPWKPVVSTLKGRVAAAFDHILLSLKEDPKGFVSFKSVQKTIGVTDRSNFRRTIREHTEFIDRLALEGIIEHGHGKYSTGFAMNFEVLFGSRVAA